VTLERCAWKGCRCREIELTYLRKPLCRKHWERLCQMQEAGHDAQARQMIGLRPRPARSAPRSSPDTPAPTGEETDA
jgi:hypothetical protein